MKNEINPTQKKIWLGAGIFAALCFSMLINEYLAYYFLSNVTSLTFSFRFFPPDFSLETVQVQKSFSLILFILSDFLIIFLEIEVLLLISRKIEPPLKFGFLSLLLSLIGVLLIKFVYKAGILLFVKAAGKTSISLLYLLYSREQILVFMFMAFLIAFGYLTYVINRIKSLLETFPKEEENVVKK